jgi:hypothetical protein
MIMADKNPPTLEGCEKVTDGYRGRAAASILEYNHSMVHSHKPPEMDPS